MSKQQKFPGVIQPRDSRGRFASIDIVEDDVPIAIDALEKVLVSDTTARISVASACLLVSIDAGPPSLPAETKERIRKLMERPSAEAIPTEHWLRLKRYCD